MVFLYAYVRLPHHIRQKNPHEFIYGSNFSQNNYCCDAITDNRSYSTICVLE